MNPDESDLHRRIDIARSRVILEARKLIVYWRASQNSEVPHTHLQWLERTLNELDKIQAEFKNPVDKS